MSETNKKPKDNSKDFLLKEDFQYTSKNPYHDRLEIFNEFVLRDDEGEKNKGSWASNIFKNTNEIEVEIGTGYGHFMIEHTQKNPHINFVGLDHRFKRSFHLAKKLNSLTHKNFRYLRARGERVSFLFGKEEVSKIYYFFPDPWPKNRHKKKRLFQTPFLDAAHTVLKMHGEILVKTDHDEYYDWMLEFAKKDDRFQIIMQSYDLREEFPEHFLASFITKFEKIFLAKGIKIKAMVLRKVK